jgi:hypothetical protein
MKSALYALIVTILFAGFSAQVYAEVPASINYQGRLTDSLGMPLADGNYNITFSIYNASSGGTQLWTSGAQSVLVINGLFNYQPGSNVIFPADLFSADTSRWLGITVGANPELEPRTKITSVAYAYHALHADTADYAYASPGGQNGWSDSGTEVYTTNINDSVGIGTSNPQAKLHIETPGTTTKIGQSAIGVYAEHPMSASYGYLAASNVGAYGYSDDLYGVQGSTYNGYGIYGGTAHDDGFGVYGYNLSGNYGYLGGADYGVYGNSAGGYAGYFEGRLYSSGFAGFGTIPETKVHIAGGNWDLTATEGDFKIGNSNIRLKIGIATGGGGAGDVRIRSHGGTNRLILGSGTDDIITMVNQKVGIRTFEPEATLHVYGNLHVEGTSQDISWQSGEHLQIGDYDGVTFTERFRITNDGKVGIGTNNPQDKLQVSGNIRMDQGTGNGNFLRFAEGGDMKWTFMHRPWANATFALRDEVGSRDVMTFEASTGNVGIGTTDPNATLEVNGDLVVTGAVRGNLGPNNGAPFPRPAYDSDWITIASGETITLTHNVGVDVNKYFVDLQFKETNTPAYGIHNKGIGGWYYGGDGTSRGAFWHSLTTTTIKVYRQSSDFRINQVRVRIWLYN